MRTIELYQWINKVINKMGFDVRRYPTKSQKSLLNYLKNNRVNLCIDIGANVGQFAENIRRMGFDGTILSFEPQSSAFEVLKKKANVQNKWQVFNHAMGDNNEELFINVSKNSVSSSIMNIEETHLHAAPESKFTAKEKISVQRLDDFVKQSGLKDPFFLKIDAQGYEAKILDGASGCFNQVYAIELEMANVKLYEGEKLFTEMQASIEAKGFFLSSLESGFIDPQSGRLLQTEAIFLRDL
jgi:FkbM family methyltransferase